MNQVSKSPLPTTLLETASDEDLLTAVANQHNRAAFEHLFSRFARRIYGMGMRIAGDPQLARDLVQEVMLTVWQNAAVYNMDRGSARSWVFALSRNKCIDMLRRARRQPVSIAADDIWPEDLCDQESIWNQTPDDGAAIRELDMSRIARFSNGLSPVQRQALEMVYVHDHTHEEAATRLNIPLGTFKSRLRLGMLRLQDMIRDRHEPT